MNNKEQKIKDYIVDNGNDFTALTETWLRSDEEKNRLIIGDLCPKGCKLTHEPRNDKIGGGVGLLYKDTLKTKQQTTIKFLSFEYIEINVKLTVWVRFVIIYRPPPSKENNLKVSMFKDDFQCFLEQQLAKPGILLIAGDFNFHMEDAQDYDASHFKNMLESFDLMQHVREPTHKSGHLLDLIITRSCDSNFIKNIQIDPANISDHYAIHCNLCMTKPSSELKEITYRKIRSIDRQQFKEDLQNSTLTLRPSSSLVGIVKQYNSVLTEVLDKHAPLKKSKIIIRPEAPWYNQTILLAKRKRRKLESGEGQSLRKTDRSI